MRLSNGCLPSASRLACQMCQNSSVRSLLRFVPQRVCGLLPLLLSCTHSLWHFHSLSHMSATLVTCVFITVLCLLSAPTISGSSSSQTKVLKSVSFINFVWGFWTFTFVISTDLTFQLLAACFTECGKSWHMWVPNGHSKWQIVGWKSVW